MKLSKLLIPASIVFLVTLIVIVWKVLPNRSEESNIGKIKSRNNNVQNEQQTPTQRIIRTLFRIITGMAVIKVIKGLLFPNSNNPDGESPRPSPSAPPLPPPYSNPQDLHHSHNYEDSPPSYYTVMNQKY